jgi:hypothetical protein
VKSDRLAHQLHIATLGAQNFLCHPINPASLGILSWRSFNEVGRVSA